MSERQHGFRAILPTTAGSASTHGASAVSAPQGAAPARPTRNRMPALDGIRALAAVAVFFYHAGLLDGGFLGVDLFFVLSGFLITDLLIGEYDRKRHIDLIGFWLRRGFRLIPALAAFLVVGLVLGAKTKPDNVHFLLENDLGSIFGIFNWYGVFGLSRSSSWDGHLWSLAVEAQFYMFWPFIVFLAMRSRFRKHLLPVGVGLIVAIALWRFAVSTGFGPGSSFDHWYRGTDTRADSLLVGAMLTVAWHDGVLSTDGPRTRRWWTLGSVLAWLFIGTIMVISPTLDQNPVWAARGGLTVVAIASAVAVGAAAFFPSALLTRFFALKPLVHLGGISYAFYLWHFPIIFGLLGALQGRLPTPATIVLALVLSITMAQLSMWLVEKPAGKLRAQVERTRAVAALRRIPLFQQV